MVLYELLTGTLPHTPRSRTPYDIARAVLEDEPMRPRTRVPTIPREMDAIVLMALRKEPNRRYPSVDYLRDDLEGYLAGQPVEAYRGNTLYRFSSFLRKNRVPLGVAALVVSVAAAGIAISRSFARRAERHLEEAVRLAAHVVREIGTATQAGRQPEVLRIAQDTRARLTRLAAEGGPNQELLRNLLAVSIEVGELQGSPGRQSVGDTEAAVKTLEEAVMLGERLYQLNAGDIRHLVNLTRARTALGNILLEQQRYDEAEAHFERGRQITAIPAGSDRVRSSYRLRRAAYAVSLLNLAQVHRRRNEFEQMFSYQKQGLAIRREMLQDATEADIFSCRLALAEALLGYGWSLLQTGSLPQATEAHQEVEALLDLLIPERRDLAYLLTMRAQSDMLMGRVHWEARRPRDAVRFLSASTGNYRAIIRSWPANSPNRRRLAHALSWLVLAEARLGKPAGSLRVMARQAVTLVDEVERQDPANRKAAEDLEEVRNRVALWLD